MAAGNRITGILDIVYNGTSRAVASAVGIVAPRAAMRYLSRRSALASYAAASSKGPNQAWRPGNKSADRIIKTDHATIRARARALVRDSSHVWGALRKITNNVVFKGITPQADLKTAAGDLKKIQNERAESAYTRWARAVNFWEKENLIIRHLWQDGELFVHFFFDESLLARGIIPLGLELLECDHLDTSRSTLGTTADNGNTIKQGIEYDPAGRPAAYWLYPEHPGDSTWLSLGGSRRYPVEQIEHIFSRERISQNRGIPWMASVIIEMWDFKEYQNSERTAARIASALAVFLKSQYPEMLDSVGVGDGEDADGDGVPDYLEPNRIYRLPDGLDIQVASHDRPGQTYEPFTKTSLRGASTGFGMSYEAYSNDYTDASYASARSASLEERRGYQVQQYLLMQSFHRICWQRLWIMNQLARVETLPAEIPVVWQVPGWPWVDPDKDSKAAERKIKNGLGSRRREAARLGESYEEINDELDREAEDGWPKGSEEQQTERSEDNAPDQG